MYVDSCVMSLMFVGKMKNAFHMAIHVTAKRTAMIRVLQTPHHLKVLPKRTRGDWEGYYSPSLCTAMLAIVHAFQSGWH